VSEIMVVKTHTTTAMPGLNGGEVSLSMSGGGGAMIRWGVGGGVSLACGAYVRSRRRVRRRKRERVREGAGAMWGRGWWLAEEGEAQH